MHTWQLCQLAKLTIAKLKTQNIGKYDLFYTHFTNGYKQICSHCAVQNVLKFLTFGCQENNGSSPVPLSREDCPIVRILTQWLNNGNTTR